MGSGGEGEGGGDEEGDADEAEKVHAEGGSEAADGGAEDFADTDLFETFLCGEDREEKVSECTEEILKYRCLPFCWLIDRFVLWPIRTVYNICRLQTHYI